MFKELLKEVEAVIKSGEYRGVHIFKLAGCTYRVRHKNLESFIDKLKRPLRKPSIARYTHEKYNRQKKDGSKYL